MEKERDRRTKAEQDKNRVAGEAQEPYMRGEHDDSRRAGGEE